MDTIGDTEAGLPREAEIWARDSHRWKRWFLVDVVAKPAVGSERVILRRLLGWDDSPLPAWTNPSRGEDYIVELHEVPPGKTEALRGKVRDGAPLTTADAWELRRFVPEVSSWDGRLPSSSQWGLRVPVVTYEFWPPPGPYEDARNAWLALSNESIKQLVSSGLLPEEIGFAGSMVVHIPFIAPFPIDVHTVVVPTGMMVNDGEIRLGLEIWDGDLCLSRMQRQLAPQLAKGEVDLLENVKIVRCRARLADIMAIDPGAPCVDFAPLPPSRATWSGDRLVLTVDSGLEPAIPAATVGLIRHIGGIGPNEPWVGRAPHLGFSPPATVIHVAPDAASRQKGLALLASVGRKAGLCDVFAQRAEVEGLRKTVRRLRVLTSRESYDIHFADGWWRPLGIEVRIAKKGAGGVHDRFLVGEKRAFLIGTSLNSLGKNHSFVTETDHENATTLRGVFEELWAHAQLP